MTSGLACEARLSLAFRETLGVPLPGEGVLAVLVVPAGFEERFRRL